MIDVYVGKLNYNSELFQYWKWKKAGFLVTSPPHHRCVPLSCGGEGSIILLLALLPRFPSFPQKELNDMNSAKSLKKETLLRRKLI